MHPRIWIHMSSAAHFIITLLGKSINIHKLPKTYSKADLQTNRASIRSHGNEPARQTHTHTQTHTQTHTHTHTQTQTHTHTQKNTKCCVSDSAKRVTFLRAILAQLTVYGFLCTSLLWLFATLRASVGTRPLYKTALIDAPFPTKASASARPGHPKIHSSVQVGLTTCFHAKTKVAQVTIQRASLIRLSDLSEHRSTPHLRNLCD